MIKYEIIEAMHVVIIAFNKVYKQSTVMYYEMFSMKSLFLKMAFRAWFR